MKETQTQKPLSKGVIYTLFVLKFISGLALIVWTVYMTFQAKVGQDDDNAFLSTYHKVDRKYNDMLIANNKFASKYNVTFYINDTKIEGLTLKDVFLPQMVISNRKIRKNILKVGKNIFRVVITNKQGDIIKSQTTNVLITKNTTHKQDIKLDLNQTNQQNFDVASVGFWNITGKVAVGKDTGYFYIKTNATNN